MLTSTRTALGAVLLFGIGCWMASDSSGQPPPDNAAKQRQTVFGLDERNFQHHFGEALTRKPADVVAETPAELAERVDEVRVLLTDKPGVVVGEIVTGGKTSLKQLPTNLDRGTVTFVDTGQAPDRRAGDGVFTAQFPFDTQAALNTARPKLESIRQVVTSGDARRFVRRGPRDLVPAGPFLRPMRLNAQRLRVAAQAQDPQVAARQLGVDPRNTPLLTLPVPRPAPPDPRDLRRVPRFFDLPLLPILPMPGPPVAIDEMRSLMIVDPGTVDDSSRTFDACTGTGTAGGPWAFGHLMREMAEGTGVTPEDFVRHWLSTWQLPQEANGFMVNEPNRAAQLQARVIATWQALSPGGVLSVNHFPARLLAIINRPDLADKIGYGTAGSAGEGRFVFGLVQRAGNNCISLPFTVIFEYGIPGGSCSAVKAWHQRWKDLDQHTLGSAAYNQALEQITRDFTDHGSNPGQLPNQSALNQLRTNEIALAPLWQMREFRLPSAGGSVPAGLLDLVTVKQTPDMSFRGNAPSGTPTLNAYFASAQTDIANNRHVVPDRFPSIIDPFLAAVSDVPSSSFFWTTDLTGITNPGEVRRIFSLGTCSGCHAGETTTGFTHIGTRNLGSAASLSGFLTGIDVTLPPGPTVPALPSSTQHYHDLAEREIKLSNILTQQCFLLLAERRIPFVH